MVRALVDDFVVLSAESQAEDLLSDLWGELQKTGLGRVFFAPIENGQLLLRKFLAYNSISYNSVVQSVFGDGSSSRFRHKCTPAGGTARCFGRAIADVKMICRVQVRYHLFKKKSS